MEFFVFVSEQWLLVSVLLLLVYGYFWSEKIKAGKTLSVHESTQLINGEGALVLDVRELKDFKQGHLVDSLHIPHNRVLERIAELEPHKEKTLLLVDQMGQHSGGVGKTLRAKGFEIARLQGGISEWKTQNLPLVK